MPPNAVHKRRRDYVQRQNPGFFSKNPAKQPTREAVNAEYDRLTTVYQYDRNPAPGRERPASLGVAVTPPLRLTPGANDAVHAVEAFLSSTNLQPHDSSETLCGDDKNAEKHTMLDQNTDQANVTRSYTGSRAAQASQAGQENNLLHGVAQGDGYSMHASVSGGNLRVPALSSDGGNPNVDDWATMESEQPNTTAPGPMSTGSWAADELGALGSAKKVSYTSNENHPKSGDSSGNNNNNSSVWQTIQSTRTRRDNISSGRDASPSRGCFNCGKEGHRKAECPEPPKSSGRACHKCGEDGHIARECPNQQSGTGGTGGRDRVCFKCNEPGHISRDCPLGGATSGNRGCFNCGEMGHRAAECPSGGDSQGKRLGGGGTGRGRGCRKCGAEGHLARDCPRDAHDHGGSGQNYSGFDNDSSFDHGGNVASNLMDGGEPGLW